jgi:phosphatidylserine decarboxylase
MSEAVEPDPTAYPTSTLLHPGAGARRRALPDPRPSPARSTARSANARARRRAAAAGQGLSFTNWPNCSAARRRTRCARQLRHHLPGAVELSPHPCPADARLVEMRYLPGGCSASTARPSAPCRAVRAQRARRVPVRDGFGPMAVVLVGALNVGSIATTWAGQVAPGPGRQASGHGATRRGRRGSVRLARGEELGRFNMGSTVIVVLPEHGPRFAPAISRQRTCPAAAGQLRREASPAGEARKDAGEALHAGQIGGIEAIGSGLSISSTPKIRAGPESRRGTTISARDAASHAMCPGKACTSGTSWLRASATAVPQTPRPTGCAHRPACPGRARARVPRPAGSRSPPS